MEVSIVGEMSLIALLCDGELFDGILIRGDVCAPATSGIGGVPISNK